MDFQYIFRQAHQDRLVSAGVIPHQSGITRPYQRTEKRRFGLLQIITRLTPISGGTA
jgi:hypothetical protein